jgi:hypothetical protein
MLVDLLLTVLGLVIQGLATALAGLGSLVDVSLFHDGFCWLLSYDGWLPITDVLTVVGLWVSYATAAWLIKMSIKVVDWIRG